MGRISEGSLVGIKPQPTPLPHTEFWQIYKKGNLVSCTFSWYSCLARATGPTLQWPPSPLLCTQWSPEPGAPHPPHRGLLVAPRLEALSAKQSQHSSTITVRTSLRNSSCPSRCWKPAQRPPLCRPPHHTTFSAKQFLLALCCGNGFWAPEGYPATVTHTQPHGTQRHSLTLPRNP